MVVMASFPVLGSEMVSVVFVIYESDPSDWMTLEARGVVSATTPLWCGVDAGAARSRGFGDKISEAPVCQQPRLQFCGIIEVTHRAAGHHLYFSTEFAVDSGQSARSQAAPT